MSNAIEKFIAMFEPENEGKIAFRIMFEEALQYIKEKNINQQQPSNMRDYFAAHIIQGLLANNSTCDNDEVVIKSAWGLADKMIKERENV